MRGKGTASDRWPAIRKKGRLRYVLTRGLGMAAIVYGAWAAATLLWDRGRFPEETAGGRFVIYALLYAAWGCVTAVYTWRARERRFQAQRELERNDPFPNYLAKEDADRLG